jgi:hypothetical protein
MFWVLGEILLEVSACVDLGVHITTDLVDHVQRGRKDRFQHFRHAIDDVLLVDD